jgi:hypothetical protein
VGIIKPASVATDWEEIAVIATLPLPMAGVPSRQRRVSEVKTS